MTWRFGTLTGGEKRVKFSVFVFFVVGYCFFFVRFDFFLVSYPVMFPLLLSIWNYPDRIRFVWCFCTVVVWLAICPNERGSANVVSIPLLLVVAYICGFFASYICRVISGSKQFSAVLYTNGSRNAGMKISSLASSSRGQWIG